ncbi:SOS response-associated peptidase [Polaribacter septentrionalilitoris]|uniref:SOS response-associated peptidase n=1 Tax=Polaribacter septentrionalilitoris TaxID=2494657 RepID=UPI00135A73AB|nr:SOS response-associated peptidase [Polaribacter septentrionalilitoris]
MCYHISLTKPQIEIEDRFDANFEDYGLYEPFYHLNGFSQEICYIIPMEESHIIDGATWGLKPTDYFSKDNFKLNTLNAKSETVLDSPLYREPILNRRCLVVADGFFESKHVNSKKYPHYISLEKRSLFAFAGIYNFHDDGVLSCSILTTKANEFMSEIHNSKKRMPIILDETFEKEWLNETLKENHIKELMKVCFTKSTLEAYTVSKDVTNSRVKSDREDIIKPFHYPELNTLF